MSVLQDLASQLIQGGHVDDLTLVVLDIYTCETVVWPLRSTVLAQKWSQKQSHYDIASKFQKFGGGVSPPENPSCGVLTHAHTG